MIRKFANKLSLWIMAMLIVMSIIIMVAVYLVTRDLMAMEAEERYQSILLNSNEKIRGMCMWLPLTAFTTLRMTLTTPTN